MTPETMKKKADDLLKRGDAAGRVGDKAESKRLLRRCRRYRLKYREAMKATKR